MSDLLTKTEICRIKGWTPDFFSELPMPVYPIGKRDYYKLSDIEYALEKIRQEPTWESTKSKARHITISPSRSKAIGIEEARARIRNQRQKPFTPQNDGKYC